MSKHVWPLSPAQRLRISDSTRELTNCEFDNNDILQTISFPHANVLIMMTPARVLAYNMKPLALVASHERTSQSIADFGQNSAITQSFALDGDVEGLISEQQSHSVAWNQGKIVFYVVTEDNFLLTYQILKSSTNLTTFKEYGIPVVDISRINDDLEQDYDDALDDDTLTVFEKNRTSKIIQNGYAVTKEKGFLQFLSVNQENVDELPVKKLELRLKVVLKFDYRILDLFGFKRLSEIEVGKAEESLLVLFPHGLQLLTLEDFRLKSTSLVELSDGRKICLSEGQLAVLSQEPETNTISINAIDFSKQKIDTTKIEADSSLLTSFNFKKKVALIFHDTIMYYNPRTKSTDYKFKVPFGIKICKKLNDETLLVISQRDTIHFLTQLGNSLFSTSTDRDLDDRTTSLDYSDFAYVDKILVVVSHTGDYEVWYMWEEAKQTFADSRLPTSYVLHNGLNDIAIYSPIADSSSRHDTLQSIKLPTRTINNCVPLIKVNSNLKLMAVYVSNKNILLIQNLETNVWYSFTDITIIDMHWLGSSYLLCQIKREDWAISIQCFRFRLQALDTSDIAKYRVWEYEIPNSVSIFRVLVNLSCKYRLLKIKTRDTDLEKYGEKFYKTAEIIIVTGDQIVIFAILSVIHPSGVNVIKKFHEHARINVPFEILADSIEWITSYREGLMYFSDNKIIKVANVVGSSWNTEVLLADVERIIDVLADEIYLICRHQNLVYKIDDLWEKKLPVLSIPLDDEFYPISISSESTTAHGLHCIFHEDSVKLVVKHKIYLDQIINAKMAQKVDLNEIMAEYRPIRHYKFALEKILSMKILANEPLDQIVELIKLCDSPCGPEISSTKNHSDMLEIVSNCLRKIEVKHWNQLFSSLGMTPRDLLARCLEGNEAKILGVLLLVFLNYDAELVEDLRNDDISEETYENTSDHPDSSVVNLIRDQEMMLQVLRLLVTSAANTRDSTKAADSWDMCFQLMRLLKELDKENNTHLVQKALDMFH